MSMNKVTRTRKEQDLEDAADILLADLISNVKAGTANSADKALLAKLISEGGIRINPASIAAAPDFFKNLPFKDEEEDILPPDSDDDSLPIFSPSIKEKSVSNG